jgi:hypothetical protein
MGPRKTDCAWLGFVAGVPVIGSLKRRNERCDHCNYHGDSEECDCRTVASPVVVHSITSIDGASYANESTSADWAGSLTCRVLNHPLRGGSISWACETAFNRPGCISLG